MNAKEYLTQQQRELLALERRMEYKRDRLEELRSYTLSASDPGRERVTGGILAGDARMVDRLGRIEAACLDYLMAVYAWQEKQNTLLNQIQQLEDWKQLEVLAGKYVFRQKMRDMAKKIGVQPQTVTDYHRQALAAFEEKHRELLEWPQPAE